MSYNSTSLPWFAIYAKNRHEKNVAFILRNKGYESFLPTYVRRHRNSKKFELPLFPGYVFCRLDMSTALPVLMTPGVFSIVGNGNVPAAVPDSEIEAIKRMLASGLMVTPWPYFPPGQQVRVIDGPLRGVCGVVSEQLDDKWLVLSVHILHRSVAVKLERDSIVSSGTPVCPPALGDPGRGRSSLTPHIT
jgi:transcription termination/antitermination protein NusG